jgi:hypothetical protein
MTMPAKETLATPEKLASGEAAPLYEDLRFSCRPCANRSDQSLTEQGQEPHEESFDDCAT